MANKVLNTKIIIRNDTNSNFTRENPTLLKGEMAFELDTEKYKIGNGVDAYTDLPYYNHLDNARSSHLDTLIGMLSGGDFGGVAGVKVNGTSVVNESKMAEITIASISYSTASQTTDSDKLTSEQITLHRVAKTGSWNDLVGKPNVVDNLNSTSSTDILSAKQGNELKKLVQAIPQATSFATVDAMISNLESLGNSTYNIGHDLYIIEKNVPDFWISSIGDTFVNYDGDGKALIEEIKTSGSIQVGYYTLSTLETVKVDLTNYITTQQLNEAISSLEIDALKTQVGNIETRVESIENDANIIRNGDFVILNGGDSKTAN